MRFAAFVVLGLLVVARPFQGRDRGPERPALQAFELRSIERPRVIAAADRFLKEPPQTIIAFPAARSPGGSHDFFSESDYWWPDPAHPDGPFVRRDGESNPNNFVEHRHAMVRLSVGVPALTAAWMLTGDERYAAHARRHLRVWFADPVTRIHGRLAVGSLRGQIRVPGLAGGASGLRQLLTLTVCALKTAEIGAIAGAG